MLIFGTLQKIKVYASIDAPNSSPVELTVLLNLLQYSPGHYHYVTNPLILDLKVNEKGFYRTTISFVFWMLKHLKNISYISFYSSVKYSKIKYTLTHIFNSHKNNVLSGVVMAIIKYQLFSYLHTI